jgi:hypothetical protein
MRHMTMAIFNAKETRFHTEVFDYITALFSGYHEMGAQSSKMALVEDEFEEVKENYSTTVKTEVESWFSPQVRESALWQNFWAFTTGLISSIVFPSIAGFFGFWETNVGRMVLRAPQTMDQGKKLIGQMMNHMLTFFKTGSLSSFWNPPIEYRLRDILVTSELVTKKMGDFTLRDLQRYTESFAITLKSIMLKATPLSKEESMLVQMLPGRVASLTDQIYKMQGRKQPFFIFLQGGAGVGKTEIIPDLVAAVRNANNLAPEVLESEYTYVNLHDKYPAERATTDKTKVVVFNDVEENQKELEKNGLVPLDVLLQQVLDTAPFSFVSAELSKKSMILNSIEVVVVTSN